MNKQKEQDIQFQIECLTNDLIIMLMDDDGMSMVYLLFLLVYPCKSTEKTPYLHLYNIKKC